MHNNASASSLARDAGNAPDVQTVLAAHGILGPSMATQDLVRQVATAVRTPGGVLITGEPGTDHEQMARAIHTIRRGSSAPFVAVTCHRADPERLERDLFGAQTGFGSTHARFAHDTPGPEAVTTGSMLGRARGGTICFLELSELPDHLQARLARVLRDRQVSLAGHEHITSLDIWPMAAVDPSFRLDVDQGLLRPELIRRFTETLVHIPPLRSRPEDIAPTAAALIREACHRTNVPPKTLSRPAATLLQALPWKGNIQELRQLAQHLVTRTPQSEVDLETLLAAIQLSNLYPATGWAATSAGTLRQARQQFERDYISAVLAQHHGRIPEAARELGIQRTNLYRKMRSLKLPRPRTDHDRC